MALTRAQLLSGNQGQGVTLSGQVQGVKQGAGIAIATDGTISVDATTVTGLVKLNSLTAYNAYVWPNTAGSAGQFLKTDGVGNLAWATPQGFAVVTVSPIQPAPPDEGELWYDCTTGSLKVYQNCTAPNGWTNVSQPGLQVLPANTSAAPPFTNAGSPTGGTVADPWQCTAATVTPGATVLVVNTVTVSGLAPFQYVPIIDLNAVANSGRFTFTNNYADASGNLIFQTIFNDAPPSVSGTNFTANIKIGYGTAYVQATISVVQALSLVSPGTIAGTPTVGSVLTYTPGTTSGGVAPVTPSWIWKKLSDGSTLQTGLTSYTIPASLVGDKVFVAFSATDATPTTVSGDTANVPATGTIAYAAIVGWSPTPTTGLDTIPGAAGGPYTGTGTTITPGGCIEVSVNGAPYTTTPQAVTSGQSLDTRWSTSLACGGAISGTVLNGTVSDGTGQNAYTVTINRKPSGFSFAPISNAPLNSVQTSATAAISGINTTAYVTYGAASTGTNIEGSLDAGTIWTLIPASGTTFPITNAANLLVRLTTDGTVSSSNTAVINIGDGANSPATQTSATFTVTNTSSAAFPNLPAALVTGPAAIPAIVSGTWADGAVTVTSTGCLQISLDGTTFGAGPLSLTDGATLYQQWAPTGATCGDAADGTTITGTLTNGTYTNSYSLVLDRTPSALTIPAITGQALSTAATSSSVTLTGTNAPTFITYTVGSPDTLTSLQVSINSGALVSVPLTGTTVSAPPGATLQFTGTPGATNSTAYTVTINTGSGTAVWSVTTTAAVASITTPSITSPANGTANLNPALNTPAGIPLVGDTYAPLNGAGATQTSSTWEVYTGGLAPTSQSTNSATGVATVAPAVGAAAGGGYFAGQISTAGNSVADYNLVVAPVATGQYGGSTPAGIQYKNANTTDPNPALAQNAVYGEIAQGNALAQGSPVGTYPAFEWAGALNIGGFNDWYLPAKNELEILYFNLKPDTTANLTTSGINPNAVPARASNYTAGTPAQTTAALFQTSGAQAFSTANTYWSSSENSGTTVQALGQTLDDGTQAPSNKANSFYARAIRRVAVATPLTQTITISAAATDGFAVGQSVKGSVSNAIGVITAINGTSVTVSLTSGTFQSGDFLVGNGTAVTGSPFTVSSAPFTTLTAPQADLAVSSTYYARVKYATTNATAATSSFSGWSSFATKSSFAPSPGDAFGGGYFAGQILVGAGQDGGGLPAASTLYNLIVAPITGDVTGPNPSGNLSGEINTVQWRSNYLGSNVDAANQVYGYPATYANTSATFPVFNWCVNNSTGPNAGSSTPGTGIGGFNDWYIPAINELTILYFFLKPSTTANNTASGSNPNSVAPYTPNTSYGINFPNPANTPSLFQSGGQQAFSTANAYYWAATQGVSGTAGDAYAQAFLDGASGGTIGTNNSLSARAVRRISA